METLRDRFARLSFSTKLVFLAIAKIFILRLTFWLTDRLSDTPRQSRLSAEETVVDWSVREIREELAIDITVGEYLMSIEHTYPTFQITPIVYLTSCTNTELLLLRQP